MLTMFDQILTNFDQVLQTLTNHFFTIRPSDCRHTLQTPIYHHILPIQQLDFWFKSRTLWTCVIVPIHQEILIGHVLTIQPFDWAQSSSKQIFYHTLSIQWWNFKTDYGIKWKHVVESTYHETSITKNIQYSFKIVIYFIKITKNWENYLKITTQNLQNDHNGFVCDFWLPCFAILKPETDKNMKIKKTLKHWLIPKTHLKPPSST